MRARVPGDEVPERIGDRLQERHRDPDGERGAEGVAEPPGVFDRGDPAHAGDRHLDRAPGVDQRRKVRGGLGDFRGH